jgi:integrase
MPESKHQLAASAYHLRPSDLRKLLLVATNFRDRCLIKTLWCLGVRRGELMNLDVRGLDDERKRVTDPRGQGRQEISLSEIVRGTYDA